MSQHLAQLADTLTRHFSAEVAEQTLPLAQAWLSGSTAIERRRLGQIEQAVAAGCLIESHGFVYLARGYAQELSLAKALAARSTHQDLTPQQHQHVDALANQTVHPLNPEQRSAIDLGVTGDFGLLLGGPGTGKSTVIRLMAQAYLDLANPQAQIGLAAPTGKAAARLAGLVSGVAPMTLARMERELRQGLHLDLLIVDEASMIDLENARRLLDLLPPSTVLVWVGDPQQLDSVEPGSILAELAACARLAPRTRTLKTTYRFSADTALGRLARAIQNNQPDMQGADCTPQTLLDQAIQRYAQLHDPDPAQHLMNLSQYQLLCATRVGPWGSVAMNLRIHSALVNQGLISAQPGDGWMVMVTRNQPALGLANGDVGVISGENLLTDQGEVPLHLVQQYESAWAISVHKSQGSEYQSVGLMLGDDPEARGISKALVYTGVTRGMREVSLGTTAEVFAAALKRVPRRSSGLAEQIQQA